MKKVSLLFLASLIGITVFSQSVSDNYDDVAVIMNSNSDASLEIGTYFAQQREIPLANLIYIDCPDVEIIDTAGFRILSNQIRNGLEEAGLSEQINYLVTTKGIPVNIQYGDSCVGVEAVKCRSVDNKLTTLNSSWVDDYMRPQYQNNPYYKSLVNFNSEDFEMYLVSRLDGFTADSVKSLIDRSGPAQLIEKEQARIVIDFYHHDTAGLINVFEHRFQEAIAFLNNNNWNLIYDPDSSLITEQDNVLIYAGLIYDTGLNQPGFSWTNGAIASRMLTNSNYSFYYDGNDIQYSAMKLVNSGATGGGSYINPYFASMSYDPYVWYSRYLNDTSETTFNLAESYHASLRNLSAQYILVGDPKTSLLISHTGFDENPVISGISVFPNPVDDDFTIEFSSKSKGEVNIRIVDLKGRVVSSRFHEQAEGINRIRLDASEIPQGIYAIILGDENGYRFSKKLVKL
ncbi:MAG: TIGR03790 family protein [Bacteroidales bacterium]|nr:TIGR03790 family protein [Bacteroidales bacterium]MCF8343050.1 TIGR03790 family protein [Bacteroidales bacterium]MCF8349793.1 TIGR03790 family protein [Bacteroidales bacterium]MCF8375913.1 TIGR03790 family protein [Bacteroidales bacterium]